MSVVRVALPVAVDRLFEYWAPSGVEAEVGSIVMVSLGRRRVPGVVLEVSREASVARERLLPIGEVAPVPSLPDDVRELCSFVSAYYQAPAGLALALAVPPLAASRTTSRASLHPLALTDAGRDALPGTLARAPVARALFDRLATPGEVLTRADLRGLSPAARNALARWRARGFVAEHFATAKVAEPLRLNGAQESALARVLSARGQFAPFALQGVTGSGKTEVYLAAAKACVEAGGQVLMLVPEINLTPQLVARVASALPGARTVALHSALASGERFAGWRDAATGSADVVLGTRLAVFTPLPRLALIIVDEEHDASYKQQETVRYHARDAALWRARRRGVPVVLGSATPSLETCAHADAGRYARLVLDRRADPRALPPTIRLVPARDASVRDGLSDLLVEAIGKRLLRGEQSLVFVNRRGFATSLKCSVCAWQAGCPRCSARLVAHRVPPALICHHCGHRERIARACPDCGNVDLVPAGHGTQRLEQTLRAAFPAARLARVDRDSTRQRGAFAQVRAKVAASELDVLIGTQMLAKGHDFPRLTLVGVIGADNGLYSADFRATERLAALLVQVAGRAGRAELPGEVIVQTDFPGHPLFAALVRHDHDAFVRELLAEREATGLPPYSHLALLAAEARRREDVDQFLAAAHADAANRRRSLDVDVDVFAPVPSPLARRAGFERSQMLLRSRRRADLQRLLTELRAALAASGSRRVRWSIDVDPPSLA